MQTYKELIVWKKAYQLTLTIYKLSAKLPTEEKYGLTSQVRRSSSSVPANIAEGWGRKSSKEYVNFLYQARASLLETEVHLMLANDLSYISLSDYNGVMAKVEEISKMLSGLIKSIKKCSP